jgi:hypothetical protein
MYLKLQVIDKNDSYHQVDTINYGHVSILPKHQKKVLVQL